MKRLTVVLTSVAALVACGDSNSKYNASGIGSVELNDSVFAIHYYSNTLIISNAALRGGLRDSCRVYFSGSGELMTEGADGSVYDFTPSELSSDIRQPILLLDSVAQSSADTMRTASSREGFFAHNIHITRDWRRHVLLPWRKWWRGRLFRFLCRHHNARHRLRQSLAAPLPGEKRLGPDGGPPDKRPD